MLKCLGRISWGMLPSPEMSVAGAGITSIAFNLLGSGARTSCVSWCPKKVTEGSPNFSLSQFSFKLLLRAMVSTLRRWVACSLAVLDATKTSKCDVLFEDSVNCLVEKFWGTVPSANGTLKNLLHPQGVAKVHRYQFCSSRAISQKALFASRTKNTVLPFYRANSSSGMGM